jgi:GNAT superfamily N-acetyltransferase
MIIRNIRKENFGQFFSLEKEFAAENKRICKEKALRYDVFRKETLKEFMNRIIKKDCFFQVIEEDDKIQGYIYGYIKQLPKGYGTARIGYINKIFVVKSKRGKRNASLMKDAFLRWLRMKKVDYCMIDVSVHNKKAIAAYGKWGFRPCEFKMLQKISR